MNWISTYYQRYAALSFSLIPIKTLAYSIRGERNERERDAKRALVKWKEFQSRRATLDEMFAWSRQWPQAGIGIVCGLLSDLIVIDDDRKGRPPLDGPRDEAQEKYYQVLLRRYGSHAEVVRAYKMADDFCEALGLLETAISRTGKGRHFYFRLPRDINNHPIAVGDTTKFLPGLDTRAEGGYVLAPPSIHPSGTSYIWERTPEDGILELPNWALQAIERFPNFVQYDLGGKYEPKQLHELVRRPSQPAWKLGQFGVGEGERNDTAASFIGKVIAECPDETAWDTKFINIVVPWNETNKPPIGIMELRATFNSICDKERKKRGTTREQFYRTYAFGSQPELVTAREIGLADLHAPDYAINGFIVDGTTQLFGKPKAGKSWLALQTAVAVATGTPLFPQSLSMYAYANHPNGFGSHQGDVLYLALEDSYLRLQTRMKAVFGSADPGTWPENLTFANAWAPCFDGGLIMVEQWISSVKHPRLVVADTIAAFIGGGKEDGKGSAFRAEYRMFRPIWEMSQRFKIPVLLVDHASKGKGKFGSLDPFDAGAGTLGSQAAVDTAMIMEHSDKGPQARLHIKGRDIERGFLDIDHAKDSPVWRIAAPPIESSEEPKPAKNVKKAASEAVKV